MPSLYAAYRTLHVSNLSGGERTPLAPDNAHTGRTAITITTALPESAASAKATAVTTEGAGRSRRCKSPKVDALAGTSSWDITHVTATYQFTVLSCEATGTIAAHNYPT